MVIIRVGLGEKNCEVGEVVVLWLGHPILSMCFSRRTHMILRLIKVMVLGVFFLLFLWGIFIYPAGHSPTVFPWRVLIGYEYDFAD